MGEGGGGEEKGGKEFLSFTSLPFSLPFFPFSPETPDTQASDCPTMDSSFQPLTASSHCGLQIVHPRTPCWLKRKCVLHKQEIPEFLSIFWLVQRFALHPRVLTESASLRWVFQRTELLAQHYAWVSMYLCTSRQNVSKAFSHLTTHSAHGVNFVWSTGTVSRITSGW